MKKWLIAVLVLLVAMVASIWWLNSRPYFGRLKAGGLDVPVVFEGAVAPALQRYIVEDLNLVYRHLPQHQVLQNSSFRRLELDGRSIKPEWINFEGPGRYSPKEHHGKMLMVVWNGEQKLAVPRELIASYRSAWERQQSHRAAYRAIDGYVAFLNDPAKRPPRSMQELVVVDPQAARAQEEMKRESPANLVKAFMKGMEQYHFRRPSVLEVNTLKDFSPQGEQMFPAFKDELVGQLYIEKDGIRQWPFPMIFHQGAWKFLIYDME